MRRGHFRIKSKHFKQDVIGVLAVHISSSDGRYMQGFNCTPQQMHLARFSGRPLWTGDSFVGEAPTLPPSGDVGELIVARRIGVPTVYHCGPAADRTGYPKSSLIPFDVN